MFNIRAIALPSYFFVVLLFSSLSSRGLISTYTCYLVITTVVIAFCFLQRFWRIKTLNWHFDLFEYLLLLFFVVVFISGLLGLDPKKSIIHLAGLMIIYFFIKQQISCANQLTINAMNKYLFIVCSLFVLATILMIIFFPAFILNSSVYVNSPHWLLGLSGAPNPNAGILFTLLILCLINFWSGFNRHFYLPLLLTPIIMALLIASNSRSCLFSSLFLLIPLLSIYITYLVNKKTANKFLLAGIFIACSVILLTVSYYVSFLPHFHNLIMRWGGQMTSLGGRTDIWQKSITLLIHQYNPFTGVGLGNQYILLHQCGYQYDKAHSSYVSAFLETGIIGLFFYSLVILSNLWLILRRFLNGYSFFQLFLLLAMISLLLQASVESYLNEQLSTHYFLYIFLYFLSKKYSTKQF
ncbi:MAG: hypothetical protein A3E87_01945 [Gammaproteobacteria bacterium RIFCSPHIGHO2_12_FULL_35_23]|nr:MAG: hypothetical protein A3E87_01945 [Gammaproteobacteria bacterium RIFCSPHIGHO2_12_FULL_35_23]